MRKKRLWQVFLLFLLAGIVYACMMDDDELFSSKMSLPPEVSGAKAWYESRVTNGELPWKSANGERENVFTPDWKKAFSNEDADYRVTEVHLEGDEKFIFISPECSEKFQETGDDRYMASDIRLVIRTDKKTNATDGFIMMLFPDLSYVEANKDHPLKDFSYLKRPPDFSGAIFYHNMEGDFVKGCKYEEGTAYTLGLNVEPDETDGPQLRYYNCTEFCTTTYYYTDVYVNGDYCYTIDNGSYYDCYYANCYWVDDGWNNPGGGNSGSNNGSSSGAAPSAQAQALINLFNINDNGINNLNAKIAEMMEKCGYAYVRDYLAAKNFSFSNIKYEPNGSSLGNYNTVTRELTFKNENMITSGFTEEFLHLYQDAYYYGGIYQYGYTGGSNIEFEAKLMQDIICALADGSCPQIGATQSNGAHYAAWIVKITNAYTSFPSYLTLTARDYESGFKDYWDFLNDFKNDPTRPQYNQPIDYNLQPNALLNLNNSDCY